MEQPQQQNDKIDYNESNGQDTPPYKIFPKFKATIPPTGIFLKNFFFSQHFPFFFI